MRLMPASPLRTQVGPDDQPPYPLCRGPLCRGAARRVPGRSSALVGRDKHYGQWRVAEDDPGSDLYAESRDADVVIRYITAHDRDKRRLRSS